MMKGKGRWFLITAVFILGIGLMGSASWGDDAGPPAARASSDQQTVVAQAEAQTTPAAQPAQGSPAEAAAPATGNVPLTEVTVKAEKEKQPKEGSAEVGYKVENVQDLGPWGTMKLLDTPYSMSVITSDMIQNTVSPNLDQVFKMDPLTKPFYNTNANDFNAVYVRGFWVDTISLDGVRLPYYFNGIFAEDLEKVEVFSGLSGFLYGVNSVGGTVNYISKRPTPYYLNDVTVGDYGGSSGFVHGDFSGPIDSQGKLAYRLNIVEQSGDTSIHGLDVERRFVSGTVDYHILDNLTWEVNALTGYYQANGITPNWGFVSGLNRVPSAPNSEYTWTPNNAYNEVASDRFKTSLQYDINSTFTFRAAYLYEDDLRHSYGNVNTITSLDTYRMQFFAYGFRYINEGGYGYLDAKFDTFGVSHTLTGGVSTTTLLGPEWKGTSAFPATINNLSLSDPSSASSVVLPAMTIQDNPTAHLLLSRTTNANTNYQIGDNVKFNDQWSALVGVNDSVIHLGSFVGSTGEYSGYDKSAFTPSGSLLFKPIPWITTYATYMESLEPGSVVGPTYQNAGQILDPVTDRQYEVGAKAEVGKMLLTFAAFEIDEALQYSDNGTPTGTFVQNGKEQHRGLEFTATGKATSDLTLWGGADYIHARDVRNQPSDLEGKIPPNVADFSAKIYAEYNLPFFRALTLTGGVYYMGPSYADTLNTEQLPSWTTGDIGARYTTKLFDKETIFRLYVSNVTNTDYFSSSRQLGAPRTFALSATMRF